MSQVISAADLEYRRRLRELQLATIAALAATERKREETRLLEAETARRRKLIEDFMDALEDDICNEQRDRLPADTDARRARCVEVERQIGVFSPQEAR